MATCVGAARRTRPPAHRASSPSRSKCVKVAAGCAFKKLSVIPSIPHYGAMQIVRIGALDLHSGEFTNPQRPTRRHMDGAVDLRCVALGAAFGTTVANLVDDDLLAGADAALEAARRDRLLAPHETVPAFLLDLIRHGRGQIVGSRALHRLVAETADPVERRLVEPVEQKGEFLLGLARETNDEG